MLRLAFFTAFFALLFAACSSTPEDDGYKPSPGSSARNNSSSSLGGGVGSSSSVEDSGNSSSGDVTSPSSSSQISVGGACDFSKNVINEICSVSSTVKMRKNVSIGPQAKLTFADNTNLELDEYTLNVVGGAEFYFGENSKLVVESWGSLEIVGNSTRHVLFTATNSGKPWAGIEVNSRAYSADINYMDLSGASVGIDFGKSGRMVLKNSRIHDNQRGIKQNSVFDPGSFSGNSFYSNGYDAEVLLDVAASLGSAGQFNKESGGLHITGNETTIREETELPGVNYSIDGKIIVQSNLIVNADAHFYFSESSSVSVRGGNIRAVGANDKPIIFEAKNENGFWGDPSEIVPNASFIFEASCNGNSEFKYFKVLRAKVAFVNHCENPVSLSWGEITYLNKDRETTAFSRFTYDDMTMESSQISQ